MRPAVAYLAIAIAIIALPVMAQKLLPVPSGQKLIPYEALWEDRLQKGQPPETWLILRFLAPEIAKNTGRLSYNDAEPDLDFLCKKVGIPLVQSTGGGVDQIIVTLLDQPLPRGERNSDVTQFGNAYRIVENKCQWEY